MSTPTSGSAALLVALAACAGTPQAPASRPEPVSWDGLAREKLLQGFDAPGEDAGVGLFDRVLLGLSLSSPRLSDRWMLDVLCIGKSNRVFTITWTADGEEPRTLRTSASTYLISLFDAEGLKLGDSMVAAPTECLSHGFVAACASAGRVAPPASFDEPLARGVAAMLALVQTIQEDRLLADILWKVVDKPGLFTFLTTWSTTVQVTPEFEHATREPNPLDGPWGELGAWSFPYVLAYGGKPLLRGRMLVTEPRTPLTVAGGLISMDGYRVSDPETRFELRVLAARRSPPTSRPRPDTAGSADHATLAAR
jgi:hypothetical protein